MPDQMLPFPWLSVLLILGLVTLNGLLAMSELGIVSARESRLKSMAKAGSKGAARALHLASNPGKFLSTVQIGITLIGIVAGAFSGTRLGMPVAQRIAALGVEEELALTLAYGIVISLTTYASLVIGELVPKQIALKQAERIAAMVATPMAVLARVTSPLVWVLDKTSALVLSLLNLRAPDDDALTAEELHMLIAEAQTAGVLEESERAIISGVVRLADRPVRDVMTPRTDIDWLDADATVAEIRVMIDQSPHSRLPVAEGSVDDIIGVLSMRELAASLLAGEQIDLRKLAREPLVVPDLMDAMDALEKLRSADVPLALVQDEYGHLDGLVTPGSLLTALAGNFANDEDEPEPLRERDDGSYLVSGSLGAETLAEALGFDLPGNRDYTSAAGFALSVLRRIPEEGEKFAHGGWTFEIVDMDGRKIDKLIAARTKRRRKRRRPAEA